MKKKILALLLTAALCLSLAVPCFAASGNKVSPVQAMYVSISMNSVGGVSPKIYYRSNSDKTIKYITWSLVAYNRVGDPVSCQIKNTPIATVQTVGPIEKTKFEIPSYCSPHTDSSVAKDDPFKTYTFTTYYIASNGTFWGVNADRYGNLFAYNGNSFIQSNDGYAYLTDDEINNALFKSTSESEFGVCWYNSSIASVKIAGALVTYMDGTSESLSADQVNSPYKKIQNPPFKESLAKYASVYNYKSYMAYNPDLASTFGDNQWKLFQHFINSGMKEGRQASSEFNLAAYKANNPDLVSIFGDDNSKYYEHYISSGKAEGRKAV